jgi:hypothetical protein
MSDWEDFCDTNDWSIGSDEDYDQFLESLEDGESDCPHFDSYENAMKWAKVNPGRTIKRAEGGSGFEAKPPLKDENTSCLFSTTGKNNQTLPGSSDGIWNYSQRCEQIARFSPHLKDALTYSGSNNLTIHIPPFDRTEWRRGLQCLDCEQLEQLRLLLLVHFEDNQKKLKLMESGKRRHHNAKPRHDEVALTRAIQWFVETILPDIDRLLIKR